MEAWFLIDLQLFAGEKTEKATPRRREEARRKGQVFRSLDLSSAVVILTCFAVLNVAYPFMLESIRDFTARYLLNNPGDFTIAWVQSMTIDAIILMTKMSLPIVGTATLSGIIVNLIQIGFIFSPEALGVKMERINPVDGFKRIFSKRSLVELIKTLLKVIITGYVLYKGAIKYLDVLPLFMDMDLWLMVKTVMAIVFELAMKAGVMLLILGVLDYLYQRWEYEEGLKMSKQEVKEEYKNIEGDPLIKSKQKQRQREMAMRRMMAEVPKADVVITNPTHFAVALKYDANKMSAPVVVARGQDFVALRIKEIAKENGVTVVENKQLARTLYYLLDIGDLIPEDMYQAVAEVLAFVYRKKKAL
ncbi:MAG: flagellar biosynthesis protein FlhB [Chitinophagales bacterium]